MLLPLERNIHEFQIFPDLLHHELNTNFVWWDVDMLDWLLFHDLPIMIVITKVDKCTNRERSASIQAAKNLLDKAGLAQLPIIAYSAEKHEGRVPCWMYLADQVGLPHLQDAETN